MSQIEHDPVKAEELAYEAKAFMEDPEQIADTKRAMREAVVSLEDEAIRLEVASEAAYRLSLTDRGDILKAQRDSVLSKIELMRRRSGSQM